jgi:hypothetical protein
MIPELEECAETEKSNAVDEESDQYGCYEETPTTTAKSATSISWTYIPVHVFLRYR